MTFISYAENFEDVMLWRARKRVKRGFYIDVGAISTQVGSVACAFYQRGWRGINIGPNAEFHRQLCLSQPLDDNLNLAIRDPKGVLPMNFIAGTDLSTVPDITAREQLAAAYPITRQEAEVMTLVETWQKHVPAGQPLHFLKIDIEGFETAVVIGNNWQK